MTASIQLEDSQSPTLRAWLQLQLLRLTTRAAIMASGILAAAFWTAALILGAWLQSFGLAWLAWMLLAVWCVLALPALYVDAILLADLLNYLLTGRTYFFPIMERVTHAATNEEVMRILHELLPSAWLPAHPPQLGPAAARVRAILSRLGVVIALTSPFGCLSSWAMLVLLRAPASVQEREQRVRWAMRDKRQMERILYRRFAFARQDEWRGPRAPAGA